MARWLVFAFVVVASVCSSVVLDDGANKYQISPFRDIPVGGGVEISSDFRFECLLSFLKLPTKSYDLIEISQATDVHQCLSLPKSSYGNPRMWKGLNPEIPCLVLLQMLDDDRYGEFERILMEDHTFKINWLSNGPKAYLGKYDTLIFPNRRFLKTLKTFVWKQPGFRINDPKIITFLTANNFIDWARVFFETQVESYSDDEIREGIKAKGLRRTIVKDIVNSHHLSMSDERLVGLVDCFIFCDNTLPFFERFERCVNSLKIVDISESDGLSSFHNSVVMRRNEHIFIQTFHPDGGQPLCAEQEDWFVDAILKLYSSQPRHMDSVCLHLNDMIVRYVKFFSPHLWQNLGMQLQMRPEYLPKGSTLVLIGYFLGHVELLQPFFLVCPELAVLPRTHDRSLQLNFSRNNFNVININYLYRVIDMVMIVDHKFQITEVEDPLMHIIGSRFQCLSVLSFVIANKIQCMPNLNDYFHLLTFHRISASRTEPFKSRIYPYIHSMSDNLLGVVVSIMGFDALDALDGGRCVWFLENVLEKSQFQYYSADLLRQVERYFPLIVANKSPEWIVRVLQRDHSLRLGLSLDQFLHLMAIKHCDLTNALIFNELLRFGAQSTRVFVQLFRKIESSYQSLECELEAMAIFQQLEFRLFNWLSSRFTITLIAYGRCKISRL